MSLRHSYKSERINKQRKVFSHSDNLMSRDIFFLLFAFLWLSIVETLLADLPMRNVMILKRLITAHLLLLFLSAWANGVNWKTEGEDDSWWRFMPPLNLLIPRWFYVANYLIQITIIFNSCIQIASRICTFLISNFNKHSSQKALAMNFSSFLNLQLKCINFHFLLFPLSWAFLQY